MHLRRGGEQDQPHGPAAAVAGHRLSRRNDAPEAACRPFAADRDGTVVAEGGGLVILEELEHARQRGARIYAELVGFGASHDVHQAGQPGLPSPDGRGVATAARKALADAGLTPADVDLAAASGYGLVEHDRSEAAALRAVLGPRTADVPVLSIKAGVGNSGAGSGAVDFIAATLALYHHAIPPAVNSTLPDPLCGLKLVTAGPVDARIGCALTTAFALTGGQCAALVLRRYTDSQ